MSSPLSVLILQEKPLNKSLQRGEDPQFDQVCTWHGPINSNMCCPFCFSVTKSSSNIVLYWEWDWPLPLSCLSFSPSPTVDQQYEFSGRVLPAIYPEDSVWLVQEAEWPGRWISWISTQSQHQVKKVRGRRKQHTHTIVKLFLGPTWEAGSWLIKFFSCFF